jgi:hypothetical protein
VPAHRNAAYIALEDRLRKYLHDLHVTRARHRRTGRVPIRLVGGPAHGQLHTAHRRPPARVPLTWVVRDPSVNYDRVVSRDCSVTWLYQMAALPDTDMVWPYRYTGHPGAVHQPRAPRGALRLPIPLPVGRRTPSCTATGPGSTTTGPARTDPQYNAQWKWMIRMLETADMAMEDEGIDPAHASG